MRRLIYLLILIAANFALQAQQFDKGDSLRGMLTPLRTCYDITYYHLDIKIDPNDSTIGGSNLFKFKVAEDFDKLQFDLFENLNVTAVVYHGDSLTFTRAYDAVFVTFREKLKKGTVDSFTVYYNGTPTIAKNAPWDGGFTWTKDKKGRHWVGVSCEGIGASLWWPNKDHLSDEPDSMLISVTVPERLFNVSNGRLRSEKIENGWATTNWFVASPINNYNVTVNIAHYEHINDSYYGKLGSLDLDYYVLDYNVGKAKEHFKQVQPMMKCFEQYMGPYPYYEDGYKLIETPYLGMEHQSAIAYGNMYKTGYAGMDYSMIGLDFDYIIIHETGHEWWGNHVSMQDIADMWIHEGFCTYSEAIYVECMHGYDVAMDYVNAKKPMIGNSSPIIGIYDVNHEGDGDMYNKGMLMLNTLRHVIDNDELWWSIITGIQKEYGGQTVTTEDIVYYINKRTDTDYNYFFDQYLRYSDIPVLEYQWLKHGRKSTLRFRWLTDVKGFHMPVKISFGKDDMRFVYPTTEWTEETLNLKKGKDFVVDTEHFYIKVKEVQ